MITVYGKPISSASDAGFDKLCIKLFAQLQLCFVFDIGDHDIYKVRGGGPGPNAPLLIMVLFDHREVWNKSFPI